MTQPGVLRLTTYQNQGVLHTWQWLHTGLFTFASLARFPGSLSGSNELWDSFVM